MISDISWNNLSSNWYLRQLDVSYNRFHRHPLYRHWSIRAYEHPWAHKAEIVPEKIMEWVMIAVISIPIAALVTNLVFGNSVFEVVGLMFSMITFLAVLLLSVLGSALSTLVASMPVAQERASGRWELLMMLPRDRANVLVMRISSMLYPYRPVLITLDVLQNVAAFLSVAVISLWSDMTQDVISLCFLYMIPCLLFLSWERRQDHVLSLAAGGLVGLSYDGRQAFRNSFLATGFILAFRIMFSMAAFLAAGTLGTFTALVPTFIGGPAMLPIAGVPLLPALIATAIYYGIREGMIALIWRRSIQVMDGDNFTGL